MDAPEGATYLAHVVAARIGVFRFKGSPEDIPMAHITLLQLAGRRFPTDAPKVRSRRRRRRRGRRGVRGGRAGGDVDSTVGGGGGRRAAPPPPPPPPAPPPGGAARGGGAGGGGGRLA